MRVLVLIWALEAFGDAGHAGQGRVVQGHFVAEFLLGGIHEGFGVALLHAGDEEAEEAADESADAGEDSHYHFTLVRANTHGQTDMLTEIVIAGEGLVNGHDGFIEEEADGGGHLLLISELPGPPLGPQVLVGMSSC